VAAFCGCCGAEITLKAEACPACGAPQHGMLRSDLLLPFEISTKSIKSTSKPSEVEKVADA
jgi:predicted amidophosphoribosyltransferase